MKRKKSFSFKFRLFRYYFNRLFQTEEVKPAPAAAAPTPVVETPAPAPVEEAPAPAPVEETPAPAPVEEKKEEVAEEKPAEPKLKFSKYIKSQNLMEGESLTLECAAGLCLFR